MNKIKYKSLSLKQNRDICSYHQKNKEIKQKQLILYFRKEINLEQPKEPRTMSDIILL
jgi:hypothetical protein